MESVTNDNCIVDTLLQVQDMPREVIISSALCYIMNSLKKYPNKIVKSTCMDFYDMITIDTAKDILCKGVKHISNITIPKKRRIAENKMKLDLEDIFSLIQSVDETIGLDKLPRYATDNLDELPVTRLDSGGLSILVTKLDNLNDKMDKMCSFVKPIPARGSIGLPALSQPNPNWGDVSDIGDMGDTSSGPFEEVVGHRKKRKTNSGQAKTTTDDSDLDNTVIQQQAAVKQSYSRVAAKPPSPQKSSTPGINADGVQATAKVKKFKRIIGKCAEVKGNNKLKAAKPYIKKAVYAVFNVALDETVDSMSKFITEAFGKAPLTIFPILKRSGEESDISSEVQPAPVTSTAFRVCIDAETSKEFQDSSIWPNGIVVKPWKFKPKNTATAGTTLPAASNE